MKKSHLCPCIAALLALLIFAQSGLADVLALPAGVKTIGDESFRGDTSLEEVVLPEGTVSVGEYAFAGSSVRRAVIPETVVYIAETAFDGVESVTLIAREGSYAWNWAQGKENIVLQKPEPDRVPVTGISLNDPEVTVGINEARALHAVIVPSDADDRRVIWSSSNEEVVRILTDGSQENNAPENGLRCTVLGVGTGTAAVTAETEDGGLKAVCTVTVTDFVYATVITMESDAAEMRPGDKFTPAAAVWPIHATDKSIRWYSDNENVVTVNSVTGEVTAVGGGKARVYAEPVSVCRDYVGVCRDYCDITVIPDTVAAPIQYTPTAAGDCITVYWHSVPGAAAYAVYYGTSDDILASSRVVAGVNDTSLTVNGLKPGTKYYTWVTAGDENGESELRAAKSVTTAKQVSGTPLPHAPMATETGITVSWDEVEGASDYTVYYGTSPDFALARHINTRGTQTYKSIVGLKPGTVYYVWVSATLSGGEGGISARQSVMTLKNPPRTPVLNEVTATHRSVTVSWSSVTDATGYRVYYGAASDLRDMLYTEVIEGTRVTVEGLAPETRYSIRVSAVNEAGESEASSANYITTKDAMYFVPVQRAPVVTGRSVTVSWTGVEEAAGYRVYYSIWSDFGKAEHSMEAGNETSLRLDRLAADTEYHFWVCAVDNDGVEGNCSNAWSARTGAGQEEDLRPVVPIAEMQAVTENTVTVTWAAVDGAETYAVYYGTENNRTGRMTAVEGTDRCGAVITGLTPGTVYYVWVYAAGVYGMSDHPMPVQVKTRTEKLSPPAGVCPGTDSGTEIHVTWNEVPGVSGYKVTFGKGAAAEDPENRETDAGNVCFWSFTEAEYGETYYLWVCAYDEYGCGERSERVSVTAGESPLSVTVLPCCLTDEELISYEWMSNISPYDRTDRTLAAGSKYIIPFAVAGGAKTAVLELAKQGWNAPEGWENVILTDAGLNRGEIILDLPEGLESGIYQVRLYAKDESGLNSVRVNVNVTVDGKTPLSVTILPCDITGDSLTSDTRMMAEDAYDRRACELKAGNSYVVPFSCSGDVSVVGLALLSYKQLTPAGWTDTILTGSRLCEGEITVNLPAGLIPGTYLLKIYAGSANDYVDVEVRFTVDAVCIATGVIAVAEAEVGYREKASRDQLESMTGNAGDANYTKYAAYFDRLRPSGIRFYNGAKNGYEWCDVFVDWCFVQAYGYTVAQNLLCQPEESAGAGTGWSYRYYAMAGRTGKTAQPGAQIFIDWERDSQINHTGLVYKVTDGIVYTIEGNSENGVRLCMYDENDPRIYGYGYPDYEKYLN